MGARPQGHTTSASATICLRARKVAACSFSNFPSGLSHWHIVARTRPPPPPQDIDPDTMQPHQLCPVTVAGAPVWARHVNGRMTAPQPGDSPEWTVKVQKVKHIATLREEVAEFFRPADPPSFKALKEGSDVIPNTYTAVVSAATDVAKVTALLSDPPHPLDAYRWTLGVGDDPIEMCEVETEPCTFLQFSNSTRLSMDRLNAAECIQAIQLITVELYRPDAKLDHGDLLREAFHFYDIYKPVTACTWAKLTHVSLTGMLILQGLGTVTVPLPSIQDTVTMTFTADAPERQAPTAEVQQAQALASEFWKHALRVEVPHTKPQPPESLFELVMYQAEHLHAHGYTFGRPGVDAEHRTKEWERQDYNPLPELAKLEPPLHVKDHEPLLAKGYRRLLHSEIRWTHSLFTPDQNVPVSPENTAIHTLPDNQDPNSRAILWTPYFNSETGQVSPFQTGPRDSQHLVQSIIVSPSDPHTFFNLFLCCPNGFIAVPDSNVTAMQQLDPPRLINWRQYSSPTSSQSGASLIRIGALQRTSALQFRQRPYPYPAARGKPRLQVFRTYLDHLQHREEPETSGQSGSKRPADTTDHQHSAEGESRRSDSRTTRKTRKTK